MTRISAKYLSKRLVISYATILLIMTLLFALIRSMPGSFISLMTNPGMTEAQIERLRAAWGLNQPLYVQYLQFMVNYQVGNFGWSPTQNVPVWDLIVRRMPRTVILFGATFIMGYMSGPLIGMYLGWWRGTTRDQTIFTGGLFAYSMPRFWISWLVIWLFNYHLGWLPSSYMVTKFPKFEWTAWSLIVDVLQHLALPVLSIIAVGWVGAMLVMRTTMNDVVDADYVFLAEAKGVSERGVMIKHAARNALIPVATQAIVGIAFIIDGAVIIENVFNYPGMGALLVTAVLNNDYPVTQAVFFMLAVLIVVMRLLTDVAYTYLDPRIKFGEES
ncbi:MAG: ABC transporter permease [Halodesulfurarchaeum sp.]